ALGKPSVGGSLQPKRAAAKTLHPITGYSWIHPPFFFLREPPTVPPSLSPPDNNSHFERCRCHPAGRPIGEGHRDLCLPAACLPPAAPPGDPPGPGQTPASPPPVESGTGLDGLAPGLPARELEQGDWVHIQGHVATGERSECAPAEAPRPDHDREVLPLAAGG